MCARSNPAGARFCMGCGASLTALCPECASELPTDAVFCGYCGSSVTLPGSEEPTEMIKLVTILFADVVGSTAQSESMPPEDTRALMAEFFQAMSEEIRDQGGTIERLIGDSIMADFGVPLAREDDPIRAVRAALRMLERLEKFNADRAGVGRMQIRIGINTGAVSTGGSFGEQLLVMGDAVNVAARLEQAAEPGTILIGERTSRAVRDEFRLREVGSLRAKGKTEAIVAFAVEGELDRGEDPASGFQIPLVGRDPELQRMRNEFDGVRSDRIPRLLAVIGDPGVGKSRLTREFLDSIENEATMLLGRCLPYGDGVTFWPLREIARVEAGLSEADTGLTGRRRLERFVRRIMPRDRTRDRDTVRDALFASVGFQPPGDAVPSDPRETFRRLLDGWRRLLGRYAERRPVVVVLEDLHWADQTMLEVLDDLVSHLKGPVFFVCPTRPELIDAQPGWIAGLRNYTSLTLDPLSDEESRRFISLLLELEHIPDELMHRILERAEGNPFFLEEIVNRLIDEGHFAMRKGRWEPVGDVSKVEIPDNVHAAIMARLDLLSAEERRILQLAAVVGRTFRLELLQHLAGTGDVRPLLETLSRRRLVVERPATPDDDAEYAFKHLLTRDVAYESLPRRSRGAAHAAVGRWVESARGPRASEIAELVAHHFERAYEWLGDDDLRRKARVYLVVGSRNAALRFATQQAATLGRRAVELSTAGSERMEALETLADVMKLSGNGDLAWETYLAALEELEETWRFDAASTSRICASAAIIPTRDWGSIERPPPDDELQRVIDLGFAAPPHPGSARDHCLLLVARAFFAADRGRSFEARAAADEALALAERLKDPDLMSIALDALTETYIHPDGLFEDAMRITQRRLDLLPRLSDLEEITDVHYTAAVTNTLIGRYPAAVRHATEAGKTGRTVDVGSYVHALNWRAHARFMNGDWDGSLRDEAEIRRIERRRVDQLPGPNGARAYAAACFCLILRADREAEQRIDVMRRFRTDSTRFKNVSALAARGLARRGFASEALEWLDLSRWMYRGQHLGAACDVVALLEDWDRASLILAEARNEAQTCGLLSLSFFAYRLEGQIAFARGDLDPAVDRLALSVEGFTRLDALWESAWSRLLMAEALLEAGRLEEAADASSHALVVLRNLGSVEELDRAGIVHTRALDT